MYHVVGDVSACSGPADGGGHVGHTQHDVPGGQRAPAPV